MSASLKVTIALIAVFVWQTGGLSQLATGDEHTTNYVLIPSQSWPCGMTNGIPVPESGTPVFKATLKLDQVFNIGQTPYGFRRVYVIQGGALAGEKIHGAVMGGGLDFELSFTNNVMELEQILVLRTDDGQYIYLRSAGTAANPDDVRMVLNFEAPNASRYSWLNTGKFAARRTVDLAAKTICLTLFDISAVAVRTDATNSIRVTKSANFPDQPWNYRQAAAGEKRGDQIISEHVTLGAGQPVGATKGGGRNIIPITGGTCRGKISGKVLNAGADYQKLASPMTLDARYLWQTDDGEVIIVRNGGTLALLAPRFEVREDSKYAWLNRGTFLSSGPNLSADGVGLAFYQSNP